VLGSREERKQRTYDGRTHTSEQNRCMPLLRAGGARGAYHAHNAQQEKHTREKMIRRLPARIQEHMSAELREDGNTRP
jgi:hypothetical protein